MCAVPTVDPKSLIDALKKVGYLDGYNIAFSGETKISIDGGTTMQDLIVGFCWKSETPEIVVTRPDGVVHGKTKKFWKFW